MTGTTDDLNRADKFISRFDDKLDSAKVDFELGGGIFNPITMDTLHELELFFNRQWFKYQDENIETTSSNLVKSFTDFFNFIKQEFEYKETPGGRRYVLHSELKWSNKTEEENKYTAYAEKYDQLLKKFFEAYENFFEAVRNALSKKPDIEFSLFGSPFFDEVKSEIVWGKERCPIEPNTNHFYFCKIMFSRPLGSQVPYDEIFQQEGWTSEQDDERSVRDAMYGINGKIKEYFGKVKFFSKKNAYIQANVKASKI